MAGNSLNNRPPRWSDAAIMINILFAFPLTYMYINLLAWYFSRCDIGINASANSLGLIFITAPTIFISFLITCIVAHCIAFSVFDWRGYKAFLFEFLSLLLVFIVGFDWELWRLKDYPHNCDPTTLLFMFVS